MGDATGAVPEAGELHDAVDGGRDLLADGPDREVEAGHQDQRLQTGEGVTRGVGVDRGDRAVVTRVHGLEHVERLSGTTLADHDAVGAHAEGVLDQITDRDLALALDVRGTSLQGQHVVLVQLELLCIFHRDDALVCGDEGGEHVQRGRLAGTGTARHEDVELADHHGLEEPGRGGVQGAEPDQVVDLVRVLGELPDGEEGPADGERVDHRVDAGAVGEAGVAEGLRLVDAPADLTHDLVDDPPEVGVVHEAGGGLLDLAGALHVHRVRAVDHDLGDVLVLQQPVDRAVAQDVVGDVLDELRLVGGRQRGPLLGECRLELLLHPTPQVVLGQPLVVEDRPELVDQVVVDLLAKIVEDRVTPVPDAPATRRGAVGGTGGAVALLFVEALVEGHIALSAQDQEG